MGRTAWKLLHPVMLVLRTNVKRITCVATKNPYANRGPERTGKAFTQCRLLHAIITAERTLNCHVTTPFSGCRMYSSAHAYSHSLQISVCMHDKGGSAQS
jgi:hypothetical protein